jgi:NCAIR mutase (PurE)-related protein
LREVLEKLAKGQISVEEAEKNLRILAIEEISDVARVDIGRMFRKGIPEFVLGEGKKPEDVAKIALKIMNEEGRAIITRVEREHVDAIQRIIPDGVFLRVDERARMIVIRKKDFEVKKSGGKIGILTAGTSDIPIAEEARIIAEEMGCEVLKAYDVGVAGIHRIFPPLREMIEKDVDVIIVVAGREGALPSIISGLVNVPIIAVPTSVGYGFGEKGLSALMAMLQSCPLGIAVVNIDGGAAAGTVASLIANRAAKFR